MTGRQLGDFLVLEKIGSGGFGEVYRASQLTLQREAVVKVLHKTRRSGETQVSRFLREARLATKLDHPYAAHIYAFGAEEDGTLWIAMEYVRGMGLDQLIRTQGALPLARFLPLLERLCEVVDSAHDQGIIHRDLKPANVMVITRAGRLMPKLLDLGIARLRADDPGPGAPAEALPDSLEEEEFDGASDEVLDASWPTVTVGGITPSHLQTPSAMGAELRSEVLKNLSSEGALATHLTQEGVVMGSPHYMAPEQWLDSSSASAQTDIYAIGILTFFSLTQTLPFTGGNIRQIAKAHVQNPPPRVPEGLPESLNDVFAKVFARNPSDRHANALQFARELRAASGIADGADGLPQLDEELRESLVALAPQPLAEAVAHLEGARTLRQIHAMSRTVFFGALNYLGVLALAGRARVGPGQTQDSDETRTLLRKLRTQELSAAGWWALVGNLCQPFEQSRQAHPLPMLIDAVTGNAGKSFQAKVQAFENAASRIEEEAPTTEELTALLSLLSQVLRPIAPVLTLPLLATHEEVPERWLGCRRARRLTHAVMGECPPEGEVYVVDGQGQVLLTLNPVVQLLKPTPGAIAELFFLRGAGRFGAKLTSLPLGFERHDDMLWEWFDQSIGTLETELSGQEEDETPYLGLAAFTRTAARHFFGREREAEAFANRLRVQSLICVAGPSGAGKSSFVQAGVIPLLPESCRAVVVRPGRSPLAALISKLSQEGLISPEQAAQSLEQPKALATALRQERVQPLLLVVDQFEELVTLCQNEEEQSSYAQLLVDLAHSPEDLIRVVLTLRDDFLIRVQQIPALRERLGQGLQLLGTPAPDQLLRILTEPARRQGYQFETDSLATQMVEEVRSQPGALALLSFTATKLWELRDRKHRRLTQNAYQALGGVGGALGRHAEATLGAMAPADQQAFREMFRHLVTAQGTRATLSRHEVGQLLGGAELAGRVLEHLISARLLVVSEGEKGNDRVEVIHEALLSSWPRLVQWQREDAEGARIRDQVRIGARQWHERGRPRGLLWRDDALLEYRVWRARYPGALTDIEEAFAAQSLGEASRGRKVRTAIVVSFFALLVVGLGVTTRANQRAQLGEQAARNRLAQLRSEQGRLSMLAGKPLQALVYLEEAFQGGIRGPGIDYLLSKGLALAGMSRGALEGHSQKIVSVAVSPDDTLAVTASEDKTARVWGLADRKSRHVLEHGGTVRSARISPDGKTILTAGEDGVLRHFDLHSGVLRAELRGHQGYICDLRFSSDGRRALTASRDKTVRIWDVKTHRLLQTLTSTEQATMAAFSPSGNLVATVTGQCTSEWVVQDFSATLWDTGSGQKVRSLVGHRGVVRAVAFDPSGKWAVTASDDATARIWDVATGKQRHLLSGHSARVLDLAVSPGGKRVVTISDDRTARVWNLETGQLERILSGHSATLRSALFSPDGSMVLTTSDDTTSKLWSSETGRLLTTFHGHTTPVLAAAFFPGGRQILTSGADGQLKFWDAQQRDFPIELPTEGVGALIQFNPDGSRVFMGENEDRLKIWKADGHPVWSSKLSEAKETTQAWSADERLLATVAGKEIHLWSLPDLKKVGVLVGGPITPYFLWFSNNGHFLVTHELEGSDIAVVWDLQRKEPVATIHHDSPVYFAAFSPDSKLLLSSTKDGRVRVSEVETGRMLKTWKAHETAITVSYFSPDSQLLFTSGRDQTVKVWKTATGENVTTLRGLGILTTEMGMTGDGRLLVTGGYDGTIRFWETASWRQVDELNIGQKLGRALIQPGDQHLLVQGSDDGWMAMQPLKRPSIHPDDLSSKMRCLVPYRMVGQDVIPSPTDAKACTD